MAIFTAAAVAAAIGITEGFIATAVAFTLNAAVYAAASFGLSYAAKAISGGQAEQKKTDNFAVQGKLTGGGAVPRSFGLGLHMTPGSLVYANQHGNFGETPNAYVTQVIALSDLPGERLRGALVNGQRVTLPTGAADATTVGSGSIGYAVPEFIRPHNGDGASTPHLWIKYYDGTQAAADSYCASAVSNTERPYGTNRIGRGICYVVVTYLADENLWNGFPEFKWELSGVPLYDPSKDSTIGGAGSHRYPDPTTWGGDGDDLPAVQVYNILHGFHYSGTWLYGLQNMAPARLPIENWINQIAKCRAIIVGASGAEPMYRSGGQINVDTQAANALETILTTCQGRISEIGGFYKIHVGEPDSPTFSFSDDDILSTETQLYKPFFSLSESVNGIQARYPDPAQGWNYDTAPPYYRADLEIRDGNRRLMASPQFDFVPYAEQVQRLQKSAIEEAQRARTHTFVLPPAFWIVEPGDVGTWTSARNGYDAKLFRVDSAIDQDNLDITLNLTEVDAADYDWDTHTEFVPVTGGATVSNPPPAQGIANWNAQSYVLTDETGITRRPAILISWDVSVLAVSGVEYDVRYAVDGGAVTSGRSDRFTAGNLIITTSILPAQTYQVRGRFIPSTPRDMAWSSWVTVSTPDIRYSLLDLDAAIKAQVTQIQDAMQAQLDDAMQRLSSMVADVASRTWVDKREVRSDLYAVAGNARADIASLQQVVVDNETAFANYQTTVSAQFGAVDASVVVNSNAIATLNGFAAASYGVTLDVNGFVTGYKLLNAGAGSSSFVITADKFQVALPSAGASGAPVFPFTIANVNGSPKIALQGDVFADGTVNVKALNASSLSTLVITSPTGKMVTDYANGVIKIFD